MTAAQFVEFLNKTQRDPRLNEILYPYANTSRAKDLIQQYEPNKYNAQRGMCSQLSSKSICHHHHLTNKEINTVVAKPKAQSGFIVSRKNQNVVLDHLKRYIQFILLIYLLIC
jgi:hypothetical protein